LKDVMPTGLSMRMKADCIYITDLVVVF
jgi:hypothetical protein